MWSTGRSKRGLSHQSRRIRNQKGITGGIKHGTTATAVTGTARKRRI
jgi:hypothetical protein